MFKGILYQKQNKDDYHHEMCESIKPTGKVDNTREIDKNQAL
jgi:hypothetical protein